MSDMRAYILELKNNRIRRVEIPSNWKVTFGPLVPSERNREQFAWRAYDGQRQQLAFTDVLQFYAADIQIWEHTYVRSQLVDKYPALKSAADQYEMILKICQCEEDNSKEEGTDVTARVLQKLRAQRHSSGVTFPLTVDYGDERKRDDAPTFPVFSNAESEC